MLLVPNFGQRIYFTPKLVIYIYISERRLEHIDNELERLNQQLHSQTSTESIDNGTRYSHDIVKLLIVLFEIYSMGLVRL